MKQRYEYDMNVVSILNLSTSCGLQGAQPISHQVFAVLVFVASNFLRGIVARPVFNRL